MTRGTSVLGGGDSLSVGKPHGPMWRPGNLQEVALQGSLAREAESGSRAGRC